MYEELIEEIAKRHKKFGESMQPPASPKQISTLREKAERELHANLPEPYLKLLSVTNGIDWNGTFFLASEDSPIAGFPDRFVRGFVEWNLLHRDIGAFHDLLVFGESGIDLYVYQLSLAEYQIRDTQSLDVMEISPSFDALVIDALKKIL
jgi:hypothetical protein